MFEFLLGLFSALWLGILTSISPCPMATNIAAISFIGRDIDRTRRVFLTGLSYTFGRMLLYSVIGILLITFALSIPLVSHMLQKYMNRILGPILIFVGLILLELIRINLPGFNFSEKIAKSDKLTGIWGAMVLGIVFALSFCPVSAALFFGSLIPLSIKSGSTTVLPAMYGLGTGLPVILFAALISFGARSVGKIFNKMTQIELWVRRVTGCIFIIVGCYYSLQYLLHVL